MPAEDAASSPRTARAASRLAAADKVRRDAEIVRDRARGLTWPTVAERHGLSERQCRTIWAERRSGGTELLDVPPVEALRDAYDQLDTLIEDAALLAEKTANDSVKVAALKLRHTLLGDKIGLLQACGLLPRSLRWFRTDEETKQVLDMMLGALDKHNVGQDVRNSLLDACESALARRGHLRPAA